MQDYIIIAIVAVIAIIGLRSTIKHFKGQGGCCGGSNYKPKKKKLKNVKYQKTFQVEGMHCDHCKNRVEEVVNNIKGVAGKVKLKKGLLTVSYAEDVDDETIKVRIERLGYSVSRDMDRMEKSNTKKPVKLLYWFIGAAIWAVIAWLTFSEGRIGIASIQVILSVGFMIKFVIVCVRYKSDIGEIK